jgi:hypothetical protein
MVEDATVFGGSIGLSAATGTDIVRLKPNTTASVSKTLTNFFTFSSFCFKLSAFG